MRDIITLAFIGIGLLGLLVMFVGCLSPESYTDTMQAVITAGGLTFFASMSGAAICRLTDKS